MSNGKIPKVSLTFKGAIGNFFYCFINEMSNGKIPKVSLTFEGAIEKNLFIVSSMK